ncbi:MAG TPA: hypothetical protein VHE83_06075 [Mycobacteriales bacterium]|nr:hypothetical protein [Mycobacteriales bacterium]
MARIVEERTVPTAVEETTVSRGAAGPTVVDDGSGFGLGMIAGVLIAIAIAVLAVLWATGSFHNNNSNNRPGSTVTSTVPGGSSDNSGSTGNTGSTGSDSGSTSNSGSSGGGTTTTP